MKRVAVFGKPGGGKSTLSKRLEVATGIKLYALDLVEYEKNGEKVESAIYDEAHRDMLLSDTWIIEGFGPIHSFNERIRVSDTLIYIDLPYFVHYWWVTKRFLKGVFSTPEGWPQGCSVLKGTIQSYKVLKICPTFWNDDFLKSLEERAINKTLYVIRTVSELDGFIDKYVK